MSEPGEFCVGVLYFFAIALPGAIATCILAAPLARVSLRHPQPNDRP
ncbi:MAG: hypothetical protein ABI277_18640 [Burkholderiaceae bacterium]